MNPSQFKVDRKKGQAMLLTVIMLSGVILSVSLVAGLLMIYQIRQASNFANSAKAIFAADSGVEWWFYNQQHNGPPANTVTFGNGASFDVTVLPAGNAKVVGIAGNSKRALLVEPVVANTCSPTPDMMLVLDRSSSIDASVFPQGAGYESALRSYVSYLSAITSDQAHFGLEVFNGAADNRVNLSKNSSNSSTVRTSITNLNYGSENSGANLDNAIAEAQVDLANSVRDRDDGQFGDYMTIVTDSPVSIGANRANVSAAATAAKAAGTKIIVVGVDPDPSEGASFHSYLASIASPGYYVSSTGFNNSAYNQNLIEALRGISSSTFLNCSLPSVPPAICSSNNPPVVDLAPTQSFVLCPGEELVVPFQVTDDNDPINTLSCAGDGVGNTRFNAVTGSWEWYLTPTGAGFVPVNMTCRDSCNAPDTDGAGYSILIKTPAECP